MSGRRVSLEPDSVQERRHRADLLTRSGESASTIAVRLGVSQRSVERYRTQLRRARQHR